MKYFKIYITYFVFIGLIIYTAYLYSLRWDFVIWGSSKRDGLFFLLYYIAVLPMLLVTSIVKRYFLKNESSIYLKNSFFLYTILVTSPALDTHGSQVALALGVVLCIIVCICILFETVKYKSRLLV